MGRLGRAEPFRPHLAKPIVGPAPTAPVVTKPKVIGQAIQFRTRPTVKPHIASPLVGVAQSAPVVTRPKIIGQAVQFRTRPLIRPHVVRSLIGAAVAQPIRTAPIIISRISIDTPRCFVLPNKTHRVGPLVNASTIPPLPGAIVIQQAGFTAALINRLRVGVKREQPIVTTFGLPVDKTPLLILQAIKRPYIQLHSPHLATPLFVQPAGPPLKTTPLIISQALQRPYIGRSKPAVLLPKLLIPPPPAPIVTRPYMILQAVQRGTYTRNRPFSAHLATSIVGVQQGAGVDRVAKIISQALQRALYTRSVPLHPKLAPPIINPFVPPPPPTFFNLGRRIRHQPYPGWPNVD